MREEKPPKGMDLGESKWTTHNHHMTGHAAIEAEMEGIGSGTIKADATYLIQEVTQSHAENLENGDTIWWGWGMRLSIEVMNIATDVDLDVSGFVLHNHSNTVSGNMSLTLMGIYHPEINGVFPKSVSVNQNTYTEIIAAMEIVKGYVEDVSDETKTKLSPVKIQVKRAAKLTSCVDGSHFARINSSGFDLS